MAGIGNDLTIKYNGNNILTTATATNVTRAFAKMPKFSPYILRPEGEYVGAMDLVAEQGDPPTSPMKVVLSIQTEVSGAANATTVERRLMDDIRDMIETINPLDGTGTLRFDRSTANATSVSTELLYVRPVAIPRYGRETVVGDAVTPSEGYLESTWEFWCPIPLFINTTSSTLTMAVTGAASSTTINNTGHTPTGIRFALSSVTGTVTAVTITNTTSSKSFILKDTSNLANTDYADWWHTDPREVDYGTGTVTFSGTGGDDYMELGTGNNSIQLEVTGGSGTCAVLISWKGRYLSL